MLLTIDPGLDTGWAVWKGMTLSTAGLGDVPRNVVDLTDVWIESQVIYPRSKARPEDIVTLAVSAGHAAGVCSVVYPAAVVHWVAPATWKGQVPKDIHHTRVWAILADRERAIIDLACRGVAPSKRHNVMDAVGLGLYTLQRKQVL
jgi:hypothetical protein